MNTKKLLETALSGLDDIGARLDAIGVTDKFNRHTVIAAALAEKRNIEGELVSLKTRLIARRARALHLVNTAEQRVRNVVDIALKPARQVISVVRGRRQS